MALCLTLPSPTLSIRLGKVSEQPTLETLPSSATSLPLLQQSEYPKYLHFDFPILDDFLLGNSYIIRRCICSWHSKLADPPDMLPSCALLDTIIRHASSYLSIDNIRSYTLQRS